MHNPESVLENETHKILCDFEIKTDHPTPDGELRPSRILHCCNLPEYSEESWRPEEICCHSSEIPSANADVENSKGVIIIIIIIIIIINLDMVKKRKP